MILYLYFIIIAEPCERGGGNDEHEYATAALCRRRLLRGDGVRTIVMRRGATADERAVRHRRGY